MAHGSGGNRFARGLFEPIAKSLQQQNYNVISFDFSGHGESDDAILTLQKSAEDVAAAIDFAREQGFKRIALIGHSLGAYACLKSYNPDISTMILLGALTGPVIWKWEDMCNEQQIATMQKTGYISADVNDGLRKTVRIDGKLLHDIATINQQELLATVNCPVLIVHGDADEQERDLLPFSQQVLTYLPKKSELEVLDGATHDLVGNAREVAKLCTQWMKKNMSLK